MTAFEMFCRVPGTRCAKIMRFIDECYDDATIAHMDYDDLAALEDDLGDILRGRALEEKNGLVGFDTEALRLMREVVGEALDRHAEAEAAYERREYERSV